MYYDKIQVNYFMTRKNPQSLFYSLLLRPHSDICITTKKKKKDHNKKMCFLL